MLALVCWRNPLTVLTSSLLAPLRCLVKLTELALRVSLEPCFGRVCSDLLYKDTFLNLN